MSLLSNHDIIERAAQMSADQWRSLLAGDYLAHLSSEEERDLQGSDFERERKTAANLVRYVNILADALRVQSDVRIPHTLTEVVERIYYGRVAQRFGLSPKHFRELADEAADCVIGCELDIDGAADYIHNFMGEVLEEIAETSTKEAPWPPVFRWLDPEDRGIASYGRYVLERCNYHPDSDTDGTWDIYDNGVRVAQRLPFDEVLAFCYPEKIDASEMARSVLLELFPAEVAGVPEIASATLGAVRSKLQARDAEFMSEFRELVQRAQTPSLDGGRSRHRAMLGGAEKVFEVDWGTFHDNRTINLYADARTGSKLPNVPEKGGWYRAKFADENLWRTVYYHPSRRHVVVHDAVATANPTRPSSEVVMWAEMIP